MIRRRWKVKLEREYYGRAIVVKLTARWPHSMAVNHLTVATVMVTGDDFDEKLAEAIADARQRAITLNGATRHAARKLPS